MGGKSSTITSARKNEVLSLVRPDIAGLAPAVYNETRVARESIGAATLPA